MVSLLGAKDGVDDDDEDEDDDEGGVQQIRIADRLAPPAAISSSTVHVARPRALVHADVAMPLIASPPTPVEAFADPALSASPLDGGFGFGDQQLNN